jgi:hypothetical protein
MDVTIDFVADGGLVVKLQSEALEVNIWASSEELLRLGGIRKADWDARASIEAGRCAGAPAFWCSDGRTATVLIGADDELWDIAATVPLNVVDQIVSAVASAD